MAHAPPEEPASVVTPAVFPLVASVAGLVLARFSSWLFRRDHVWPDQSADQAQE